jgi:tetratricopeptide (TPR) repeat protein
MWQTWNNCGPATLAMNLSYYGLKTTQADVATGIRPNKEDKNVSPEELAAFARAQGLQALVLANGEPDRLRQLLASGAPVLVETWHEPKPNDGMGHYRLLTGYDDAEQLWIAYDSYDAKGIDRNKPYAGIRIPYGELGPLWKVFNHQYIVIYTPALAAKVQGILGADLDEEGMWQRALVDAQAAVEQNTTDAFAWFNLGSDLTALGHYEEAAKSYDKARQIGLPWRMLWYQFGPFQAYYAVGRYEEVVALANATIRTAKYAEGSDDPRVLRESILFLEKALAIDPGFAPAMAALATALAMQYRDVDGSPATLARSESLAARAMELDPQLPESLKAAADVRGVKFDYVGAVRLYRRLIEATPRDHVAWDELCWMLGYAGPPYLEEGEAACRKALDLAPWYWAAHYHLLRIHVQQGRIAEAEADQRALEAATNAPMVESGRYWLAMATGRWKDALAAADRSEPTNLVASWRAMALAQLGEKQRAFEELERALAGGFADGDDLRRSRYWQPLRSDPRWAATLRRHGIEP